ncbi:uncharacterized protein EI97DRAFT_456615 [Westerdykella ornata]|uniref:F-box domain-containing protein n=1 Tax=Westerdykella ornata TaxID=318751 RepID=A0A6A6JP52_WESOR|nr:uncharacterized protein EI97DRAFT_456615 [Westerdykella ornata]KAF2278177.1 hypothetical protein EI97DRAFT_456615 [Westerdykella ornata]
MCTSQDANSLDLQALALSKFFVSPMRRMEDLPPAFEIPRPRKLSAFEKLPAELRHEIYSHLGVLVARRLWTGCRKDNCGYRSHPGCDTGSYWDTQSDGSDVPEYEHRSRVLEVEFERPDERSGAFVMESRTVDGHNWTYYYIILLKDWPLLHICRLIRDEVADLLFQNVNVRIGFELSDRAVHYDNWTNYYNNKPGHGVFRRMTLNPSWFASMTHIHLTREVGSGFNAKRPGAAYKPRPNLTRALEKQAKTLLFLAKYCPALVTLRADFVPACHEYDCWPCGWYHAWRGKPKQSMLDALIAAYVDVVGRCTKLQSIVIPRADFQTLEDDQAGSGDINLDDRLQVLELRDVLVALREEAARKWLKVLMDDLVAFRCTGCEK